VAAVNAGSARVVHVARCADVGVDSVVITLFRVVTTITVSVIGRNSRHDLGLPRLSPEWNDLSVFGERLVRKTAASGKIGDYCTVGWRLE